MKYQKSVSSEFGYPKNQRFKRTMFCAGYCPFSVAYIQAGQKWCSQEYRIFSQAHQCQAG